jgi:hypothetical protein
MITKKLFLVSIAFLCLQNSNAQYRKLTMKERVENVRGTSALLLGGTTHFMGDGKGTPASFSVGLANIGVEDRWFNWLSLTVVLPVKFSYVTIARDNRNSSIRDVVTLTGKTKPVLLGDINWGCFLHNINNTDAVFKPYLSFGFNGHIGGGINENTINRNDFPRNYSSFEKDISFAAAGIGLKVGGGALVQINEGFTLKLDAGYNLIGNLTYKEPGSYDGIANTNYYHAYTSNPYTSVGVLIQFKRREK